MRLIRFSLILAVLALFGCEGDKEKIVESVPLSQPLSVGARLNTGIKPGSGYSLRQSLDSELISAELSRLGDSVSEEKVDAAWTEHVARFGEGHIKLRISSGDTIDDQKTQLRRRLESEKLVQKEIDKPVAESEIQAFYEKNRARYVSQPGFVARTIYLSAEDETARKRRRSEMLQIIQELESGTEFAVLARRYSESANAKDGGSTARLTQENLGPELWGVLSASEVGEHRIVSTPEGVYLIQLVAKNPPRSVGYEEAREEIAKNLKAQRRSEAISGALMSLRSGAGIRELGTMGSGGSLDTFRQGGATAQRPGS